MDVAQLESGPADPVRLAPEAEKRLDAWLSLPEGDRAELLGGRIVYKAEASIEHGAAVMGIAEQLGRFRGPPGNPTATSAQRARHESTATATVDGNGGRRTATVDG